MYKKITDAVIGSQVAIIGPLAREIANKVDGVNNPNKKTVEDLVKQYETLFGRASVETCKDAIKDNVNESKDIDLPQILE